MKHSRWFFHPIFSCVLSIIALGISLFLYIYWYVEVSSGLQLIVEKFNLQPDQEREPQTWVVILVLSILVSLILLGILNIFIYYQKTLHLYRLQNNFINNFTHELKTPVTSMRLYLETFLKHTLPRKDQLKYIHYMIQDINGLSENINRILNLARIESKSYKREFEPLDLVDVVRQFVDHNSHLFKTAQINISNPADTIYPYLVNRPLFEMLLMNLIINSIKYNSSDTAKIDISFKSRKQKLKIELKDNGIGFKRRKRKQIFKKFYQIGQSDDMSAKGTGLGLHVAQNIARIHKGKVVADSKGIGNGSTFKIILPYSEKIIARIQKRFKSTSK
ncbi:MAG: HAMP domain-containing histidine kinase [Desulfobacterales bacterium]|nr:HAMP domain-containing histidine kinase [Desulfobacterales bacterium]